MAEQRNAGEADAAKDLRIGWPKQARGRARFESLLAAAADLIAERGVDGAAFGAIARRTGTAQGSLYQYFASKEALVTTLHARQAAEFVAVAARCRGDFRATPPPRDLSGLVDLLVPRLAACYAAHPAYIEIRQALSRSTTIQDTEALADVRIAELLGEMLDDAGVGLTEGRRALVLEALIELGDALLPWAGHDTARQAEAKAVILSYLRSVATHPR